MGSRKAANAGDMQVGVSMNWFLQECAGFYYLLSSILTGFNIYKQGCGLTYGTSTEDTSSSGVTENPPSINGSSCPSLIPKEFNGMPEDLSPKKSENNGGRVVDDSTRVKEKKRTRTIGTKNKRLLLHSEESMELRLTWEEAQDLLRPSPSAKPSIVVIEEDEFEEFDVSGQSC